MQNKYNWKLIGQKLLNISNELPKNNLKIYDKTKEIINDIFSYLQINNPDIDFYKIPVPIDKIAKCLGFEMITTQLHNKENLFNRKIISLKYYEDVTQNPFLITYDNADEAEIRFGIAYEIAEFLQSFAKEKKRIDHTYMLMPFSSYSTQDYINNIFALLLLLPEKELIKAIEDFETLTDNHLELPKTLEIFWNYLMNLTSIPKDKIIIGWEYIRNCTTLKNKEEHLRNRTL